MSLRARILNWFRPLPAYPVAKARYDDARSRGDTRAMCAALKDLMAATHRDLEVGR